MGAQPVAQPVPADAPAAAPSTTTALLPPPAATTDGPLPAVKGSASTAPAAVPAATSTVPTLSTPINSQPRPSQAPAAPRPSAGETSAPAASASLPPPPSPSSRTRIPLYIARAHIHTLHLSNLPCNLITSVPSLFALLPPSLTPTALILLRARPNEVVREGFLGYKSFEKRTEAMQEVVKMRSGGGRWPFEAAFVESEKAPWEWGDLDEGPRRALWELACKEEQSILVAKMEEEADPLSSAVASISHSPHPSTSRAPPDVPSSIVQTLHQLKVSFDRLPSALWTTLTCRLPKSDPQAFAKIFHDVVGVRMLPTPGDVYFVAFESQRARDKAALDLNVRWEHLVVDKIGTPDWE